MGITGIRKAGNRTAVQRLCRNHPKMPAEWICVACRSMFCNGCVELRSYSGASLEMCPVCGRRCLSLADVPKIKARKPAVLPARPFAQELAAALAYPLRLRNLPFLFGYPLIWLIVSVFVAGSVYDLSIAAIGALAAVVFGGYICLLLLNILYDSAHGRDNPIDLPDLTEIGSVLSSLVWFAWATAVCLAPAAVYYLAVAGVQGYDDPLIYLLAGAGFLYLPMALLAVVVCESPMALQPGRVFAAIAKAPGEYAVTAAMMLAAMVLLALAIWATVTSVVYALPLLLVHFHLVMTTMRLTGRLYVAKRDQFAWFNEE